ncbi:sensor histidine kinase [Cohnella rhizosphaerae]|uniref:histidine kinase n=1 Tax=Cohnella rhizosphaerae TaxID=1457232 RepID=A0A9X4KV61_9BACL|nr:histidine kinase [Cohnella rhizosphaerae]MDG0808627.1 histidine kinase [Cohnella rhizosphaerae]
MDAVKRRLRAVSALFRELQYRQKLRITIALLCLVPLLAISVFFLVSFAGAKLDALLRSEQEKFGLLTDSLDRKYDSAIQKSVFIANNLQILQMLGQDYSEDLLAFMTNNDDVQPVLAALQADELRCEIVMYGFNPTLYRTNGIRLAQDLETTLRDRILAQTDDYPIRVVQMSGGANAGPPVVRLFSTIRDLRRTLAIIEVSFPIDDTIQSLQESLPAGGFVLYKPKSGPPLYLTGRAVSDRDIAAGVRAAGGNALPTAAGASFLLPLRINAAQDDLVLFLSKTPVYARIGALLAVPLLIVCGLLLAAYFSIRLATSLLTARLSRLMDTVRSESAAPSLVAPQAGDVSLPPRPPADAGEPVLAAAGDELGQLERAFRRMADEIRDRYRQAAASELERRLLETELLQVNINPHLLYNSLSAIRWAYPDERLGRLIEDMVDYYRLFLNRGEAEASLESETVMLLKYAEIQRFSYESDFVCAVELDDSLRETPILRNLLQPLVENALIHGLFRLPSGGRLTIAARPEGKAVVVEIGDNGPGIDADLAARLSSSEADGEAAAPKDGATGSGYAIANIRRRIRLYYGADASLRICGSPGSGTTAILRLPLPRRKSKLPAGPDAVTHTDAEARIFAAASSEVRHSVP